MLLQEQSHTVTIEMEPAVPHTWRQVMQLIKQQVSIPQCSPAPSEMKGSITDSFESEMKVMAKGGGQGRVFPCISSLLNIRSCCFNLQGIISISEITLRLRVDEPLPPLKERELTTRHTNMSDCIGKPGMHLK